MQTAERRKLGGWLGTLTLVQKWVKKLKAMAEVVDPSAYVFPVRELATVVASDPILYSSTKAMFVEALQFKADDAVGAPAIETWEDFLSILNTIMSTPPQFILDEAGQAQGLAGLPITAVLDWTMATASGYATYSNSKFNKYFKKVLNYWCHYLMHLDSRWVLAQGDTTGEIISIPWLSDTAKTEMVNMAMQPIHPPPYTETFEQIFAVPDLADPEYLGFTSWDQFFVREFNDGQRPVGDAAIVNACESAPLMYKKNVSYSESFYLKGQPYSLIDMFNGDPLTSQFVGGTVYQAFLSALSYHRWHSPVDGLIEKAYIIDGTYFLENAAENFYCKGSDLHPLKPMASQPFFTSAATRAVIFIRADDPLIGLVAVVPVGMTEVSSCQITAVEGQVVKKGDELGMFHYGGSTHCMVFQKGVDLEFLVDVSENPSLSEQNVAVKSNLANIKTAAP